MNKEISTDKNGLTKTDYKIIEDFKGFIKLNNKGKFSDRNKKKLFFLKEDIIHKKELTVFDYQLCSTYLAKKHDVTVKTMCSWIKKLININIIECKNKKFKLGKRSRTYRFSSVGILIVNKYNGFNKKYPKSVKKKEIRKERWKDFDSTTYEFKNVVYIASSYLGCVDSYIMDIYRNVPRYILLSPRENNVKQSRVHDFFYAYKYVTKQANEKGFGVYKSVTKEFFRNRMAELYDIQDSNELESCQLYDYKLLYNMKSALKRCILNINNKINMTPRSSIKRKKRLKYLKRGYITLLRGTTTQRKLVPSNHMTKFIAMGQLDSNEYKRFFKHQYIG